MKSHSVNTSVVSHKIIKNNVSQNAFNGEAEARANADATLQSNIDAEESARQTADSTLQYNIDAEATTRANGDKQKTAGVVVRPTRTDAVDGTTVTIGSDGIYALYSAAYTPGVISQYSIAGATFSLTDGVVTYIVADYNSGSPILRATTNREEINAQTIIPVVTIERVGTSLHELYSSQAGVALAEKMHLGVLSTDRFKVERGGLVLGASGQNVTVTAGVVWQGLAERVSCSAFNSSTNRLARWVKTSGTWAETSVTTWENTYYQGAFGQVELQNNTRYAVTHVGRTTGDDVHAIYVLGTGDYTLAEAVSATLPADLPPIFNLHCVYVGKIIAAKGATTATYVMAPITTGDYAPLSDMSAYAPLASPALTGTPTAPTAAAGTNTTQIATTAFVASSFLTTTGTAADSSKLGGQLPAYYAQASHTHAFSSLTSKPTTLAGYGITDAAAASHGHTAGAISVFSSEKIDPTTVQEAVSEFEKKNNYKPLARWFSNVSARVLSGQTVNVWAGVDSLTAGAGGYSWVQPFRLMVQDALGDGGIGLEPPCADWEFGVPPLYYVGASVEEADPSVNDDKRYGVGIQTLTSQSSCYVSFNAGSSSSILRETDEVDVYYLKFPSGGTSMRISASPNGQFYSDVNSYSATNSVGKVTLTGFGIGNGWAGSNVVVDSQNGPWRILGFNMKRTCPTGGARVHFWAKGGSTVQKWASLNSSSQQYYFGDVGCDLMILNGGMNDRNSRTKEQYKSDVQTIITNVRSANPNSAIVLVMPTIPSGDPGNLVEYRSALIELAESYDCAFIDTVWILGTNISAVANGLIGGDSVHPTERGYRAIAEYIFNFLGGGALSQLKSCSYNKWAPRRDIDATSVQGWKPGSILSVWQDFSGRVRCGRIQNYYADNICRSYNLSEVVIPETPASSSVKIYDIGLIAGYCEADIELEVTLHRAQTGSRVRRKFYIALSNWTVTDNATGYVRPENALIFKNLAGDYADIDVQCSVINNTTTGRCEIYITPTGGSSPYTSFHGIVTKSQLVFARNVIASEEAVYEH